MNPVTMTFDQLVVEFNNRVQPSGRFIKRLHPVFVETVMQSPTLNEFPTLNEKLWALKNKKNTRIVCYCGRLTSFHENSHKYHAFCSTQCSRLNPRTIIQRNEKRLDTGAAAKIQQTILERYGKKGIKERRSRGVFMKYQVDNYFATDEFKQRNMQYNLQKYNVISYAQTQECKEKYKQTCMLKYGVDHYSKSQEFKQSKNYWYELAKARLKEKYKVEHSSQIKIAKIFHLISDPEWLYNQYIIQNKSTEQLVDELKVCATTVLNYLRHHEIAIKYNFGYSQRCIQWLTDIAKASNLHIQHAVNEGEYRIPHTNYRADGYCKENNTVYEFHGDIWHGNLTVFDPCDYPNPYSNLTAGELYANTLEKEKRIKELGYNLVVMWEKDWVDARSQNDTNTNTNTNN